MRKVPLQTQLDLWLVASFNKFAGYPIIGSLRILADKLGVSLDEIMALKRAPKPTGVGIKCSVSRFVCGYIPGAADFMFRDDLNPMQKVALLAKHDSVSDPIDVIKCRAESKEKQADKRAARKQSLEHQGSSAFREAKSRRNWNACK